MSFDENRNGARRRSNGAGGTAGPDATEGQAPGLGGRRRAPQNEVGDALKAAYNRALHEDIPPEMLDLLGKLG